VVLARDGGWSGDDVAVAVGIRRGKRPRAEPELDVPPGLAGVPTVEALVAEAEQVVRTPQTLRTRRLAVRNAVGRTRSQRVKTVDEALVAAAAVMDASAQPAPAPNAVTRTWQHAAYGYRNTVGELNAGCMYVGNAMSRCTLAVGKRNPDGSVEQGYDGEEPVDGLDTAVAQEAADLISRVQSTRGGQSELLRSSGEKMFLAGELYYVPEDASDGMKFDVLSTQELLRDGTSWTKYLGPGYGAEPLAPGVTPIRVWRPDGQWSMLATSSVRSCLEILEELVVLTRLVRASAISRMALAGMLLIPDELDNPDEEVGPDGGIAEATNPLAVDMVNNGAKAIDDPANAAAWMPFVVQGPSEYLRELRHVPFEAANQEQVIQRTEALQRLAQGLDLPVEVVLGHQCVDEETEILTRRGWLTHGDLVVGDSALTLNHETGLSEWQAVSAIHRYDVVDEPLRSIEARSHSSLTTANHRWPVITAAHGRRTWRTSQSLNTNCLLPTAAPNGDLPTEPKWSDALVELVAWFYTEGTEHGTDGATIYQSATVNPQHVAAIRRALHIVAGEPTDQMHTASRATGRGFGDRTVIAWRETHVGSMVRFALNKRLADNLRALAPDKVPSVEFLTSLTGSQLELFIERSIDGDGCRVAGGVQFHQADPRRATAFELACVLSGRSVTTRTIQSTGGFRDSVRHLVLTRKSVSTHVGRAQSSWERYTGTVWCPTTANATWFARRHGRSYFTGNSTTFANAQQVSIDTFRIHLEPTLQLVSDALTVAYLWPAMAKNRGIDPEAIQQGAPLPDDVLSVAVTYDAHHLVSNPDRTKELVDLYIHDPTQSTIKISEVRDALNLDPEEEVDPQEIAARVDAIRLTKIRETIQAPTSDAAVGISSLDQAPVPGESAGAAFYASGDQRDLAVTYRILGAADMGVRRAAERLGAKLRSKGDPEQRTRWREVGNADLVAHVGSAETVRLLGATEIGNIVRAEANALGATIAGYLTGRPGGAEVATRVTALAVRSVGDLVRDGKLSPVSVAAVDELLGG
jgi:hypothetical protein